MADRRFPGMGFWGDKINHDSRGKAVCAFSKKNPVIKIKLHNTYYVDVLYCLILVYQWKVKIFYSSFKISVFKWLEVLSPWCHCIHVTFCELFSLPQCLAASSYWHDLGWGTEEMPLQYSSQFFLQYLRALVFICDSSLRNVTVCYHSTWYYLVKCKALKDTILESWLRNKCIMHAYICFY